MMLIDWFTVGAQLLNFVVLVWLMKRFLYKPVLAAIAAREQRIASELADADAKRSAAQRERDEFQGKNEQFERQRAALLRQVEDEAKSERQRLLEQARSAAEALSARRADALRDEARRMNLAISQRTQQEVFEIVRKVLTELAATSLEERLVEVFTRRLRELRGPAKEVLSAALAGSLEPALVRSVFELPEQQRALLQAALNETFAREVALRFESSAELISGIEFIVNGQKLAWNVADHLSSLEKRVYELTTRTEAARTAAAPPRVADSLEQHGG
jgi:F-type H+-transporting ATPase subunit b